MGEIEVTGVIIHESSFLSGSFEGGWIHLQSPTILYQK